MKSPFIKSSQANKAWQSEPGDYYLVTGVDANGKRFKAIKFESWEAAACINLYRGTKWLVRGGKRWVIQEVYN